MDSWFKFLKEIGGKDKSLKDKECDTPFYRGQGHIEWPLLPRLFELKEKDENIENILFCDFSSYGASKMNLEMDSWDKLFTMRHHGLPTRLLDWTENPFVALYFALKQYDEEPTNRKPVIWILDPYELNKKSRNKPVIFDPKRDFKNYDYYDIYIKNKTPKNRAYKLPIAIYPEKRNERVFAQLGVFTLHGTWEKPLNKVTDLFPKYLNKIEVPTNAIGKAKKFLELAGISEYSLFPDYDGLSRYLKKRHIESR